MGTPIKHISRQTASVLGTLVLLAVVLFFAITRTEIGRESVARQLEAQFARSTPGTLEIGRLTGNLWQSFTAQNVRVRDADGRVLLAADTVFFAPSIRALLGRRFDSRRIELRSPRLHLARDSSGTLSWGGMLGGSQPADSIVSSWRFQSARLVVVGGSITSSDPQNAAGTFALVDRVDLDARVEHTSGAYFIALRAASGASRRSALDLLEATGQAVLQDSRLEINQAHVRTRGSDLRFSGALDLTDLGRSAAPFADREFSVDLVESVIQFDEVASLIPAWPLRGAATMEIAASGTLDDFVVSEMNLRSGQSRLRLQGTLSGFPDNPLADVHLRTLPLLRADLVRLAPALEVPERLVLDSLRANVLVQGVVHPTRPDVTFQADATGSAGALAVVGSVTTEANAILISGDVEATELEVGEAYLIGMGSTFINASASISASLTPTFGIGQITAAGSLRNSRIGSAHMGLLRFDLDGSRETGRASARLVQQRGITQTDARWNGSSMALQTAATGLDLGSLLQSPGLETSLTGEFTATVDDLSDLVGTASVALDSSSVSWSGAPTAVLPQNIRLATTRQEGRLVADITGSEISGRVVVEAPVGAASTAFRFWRRALADAVGRELQKPYRGSQDLTLVSELEAGLLRQELLSASRGAATSVVGAIRISQLARPLTLAGRSNVGGPLEISLSAKADATQLEAETVLRSDSLVLGSARLIGPLASFSLQTRYGGPVEDVMALTVRGSADSLVSTVASLPSPKFSLDLRNRAGRVSVRSERGDRVGPLLVSASTDLLDDRARVRFDTLSVAARQLSWTLDEPALVDLFSDALSVENLALSESVASQRLILDGVMSRAQEDTLAVVARSLRLAEITEFSGIPRQFGGLMSADVLVTGGMESPRVTGSVRVPGFVLDDRLLGDVRVESSLAQTGSDIAVDLSILPASSADGAAEVIDNRLALSGTLRPPSPGDPGEWALDAVIERADLFFLKYVFNESVDRFDGFATGSGRIRGPFAAPIVEAELDVREGQFYIPRTGVRYTLEGEARIDREAIHFLEARLQDGDGGTARVSGGLRFNDYRFFSFDLTGTLDEVLVMNRSEGTDLPFYGFIRGTGTAILTGPLTNATLRIADGRTREDSELFIPIVDTIEEGDASFIIFADSTGRIPDLQRLIRRPFVLSRRASAERQFLDGLDMDLNIQAPRGSVIHLVIDPLLGDVINAESTGRVQIRRNQGEFEVFGQMEVLGGDYLFTAGEVFVRRFIIQPGGTLSWVGDPVNARLNIAAAYRTRASTTGLEDVNLGGALIPLIVDLDISGLVASPQVTLGLQIDRSNQNALGDYQALEARLNQPDRATEYATSVLLTNSFQLTTDNLTAGAGEQLAFNSVSQLVSSQLSRFLDAALPNVDFSFGLQGERAEDLDITYGVALRLMDERLIIRGEGVYQGSSTDNTRANTQGLQGEFVVEVRLSPSVSAQVFFRREGDILQNADLTNTAGAGLTYQTDFPSWKQALRRLFGLEPRPTPIPQTEDGEP